MALRDVLVNFIVTVDQRQLVDAEKSSKRLIDGFKELARVASVAFGFVAANALSKQVDIYTTLANKIRNVTTSSNEFEAAQRGVFQIARDTFRPVENVTDLYQRFQRTTSTLGATQEEQLDFTKRIIQATVLSGATAEETHGALIQLSQGLANNFGSAGQEIRSLEEQAPQLATIIAKAAGGGAGELMKLYKAGKITSKLVFDAVRNAGPELDALFKKRVPLFADLKTNAWNDWILLLKQINPLMDRIKLKMLEVSEALHGWVESGEAVNGVIAGLIVVGTALAVAFGPFILTTLAWTAALTGLFFIVEDFIVFMRGGESVLGDWLGEDNSKSLRDGLSQVWDLVLKFRDGLKTGSWEAFYTDASVWIFKIGALFETVLQNAVAAAGRAVADDPILSTLVKGLQLVVGKPGQSASQQAFADGTAHGPEIGGGDRFQTDHPWAAGVAKFMGWDTEMRQARIDAGINPDTGMPLSADPHFAAQGGVMGPTAGADTAPMWQPYQPTLPGSAGRAAVATGPAPVVNNTITVQGNATPATARDIASKTGDATSAALGGRDMSAVGATVGISP